ncbi:cdc42 effector protein 2 isoform 1-T2 [Spinachia spinachia]
MPLRTSLHRKPSSARWPNRNTKRREVLSVNMISLPLADFRHITHIGNGADSFGDLSFLKMGRGLLLKSSQSEQNIFLACSPPPPPKPPRLIAEGAESPDCRSRCPADASQRRTKCSSLPLLDSEEGEEEPGAGHGHRSGKGAAGVAPSGLGRGSLDSGKDEDSSETAGRRREEDSGFSFSLDLGPSILDDVLQVMDKRQ